jgi:hypothetical protein
MDLSEFPFLCYHDFETVALDATRWESGGYNVHLVFFKQFADDDTGQRAEGLILNTGICGETLSELLEGVQQLIGSGIFGSLDIADHGTLYNEHGDEIDTLCWQSIYDGTQCDLDDVVVRSSDLVPINHTIH